MIYSTYYCYNNQDIKVFITHFNTFPTSTSCSCKWYICLYQIWPDTTWSVQYFIYVCSNNGWRIDVLNLLSQVVGASSLSRTPRMFDQNNFGLDNWFGSLQRAMTLRLMQHVSWEIWVRLCLWIMKEYIETVIKSCINVIKDMQMAFGMNKNM